MKAAVHDRYGPPEVVRIAEVPKPAPKAGELLVRVHATTVNRTDCSFRAAHPFFVRLLTGLSRPRHPVLGTEFAGEVEAVGDGVTSFKEGDRVFGFSGRTFGAHAEYLAFPEKGPVASIPSGMSFEEAAPGTEGSQYALTGIRGAKVDRGQDVLVYGATGAIGSASVQLLRNLGANVTAVCATDHVDLVRGLGADRVIDHTVEDFTKDHQRYDLVLDAVGKSSFARCKALLKPRGIFISSDLGPLSQNPFLALVTPLFGGKRVKFPIPMNVTKTVKYLKGLMESGAFKPVIDRTYQLDEIVEAYRYVESGQKVGNVVITVTPSNA
jgi:NADPH:quinone reductase-like Zn-dependent oxidoreductase